MTSECGHPECNEPRHPITQLNADEETSLVQFLGMLSLYGSTSLSAERAYLDSQPVAIISAADQPCLVLLNTSLASRLTDSEGELLFAVPEN